jgi:hypothetical protein
MSHSTRLLLALPLLVSCGFVKTQLLNQRGKSSKPSSESNQSTDANGIESAKLNASQGGKIVGTASGVKGASINVPAGALAIDTTITMQPGRTLAEDDQLSELGITDESVIQAAGEAIVFKTENVIDADAPLTLQIPAPQTSASLKLLSDSKLIILAKIFKASEDGVFLKAIDNFSVDGNILSFESMHFGVYQAFLIDDIELSTEEIPALSPIVTEITTSPIEGTWKGSCIPMDSRRESFEQQEMNFFDGQFSVRMKTNTEENCAKPAVYFSVLGNYKAELSEQESESTGTLDFTIDAAYLRIDHPDIIKQFNQDNFCGVKWESGVNFDISDQLGKQGCKLEGNTDHCEVNYPIATGETMYQIVSILEDSLQLGQDYQENTNGRCVTSGNTSDNRPSAFEASERALKRLN